MKFLSNSWGRRLRQVGFGIKGKLQPFPIYFSPYNGKRYRRHRT